MTKKIKGTALILDLCCHVGNLEHLIQVRSLFRHMPRHSRPSSPNKPLAGRLHTLCRYVRLYQAQQAGINEDNLPDLENMHPTALLKLILQNLLTKSEICKLVILPSYRCSGHDFGTHLSSPPDETFPIYKIFSSKTTQQKAVDDHPTHHNGAFRRNGNGHPVERNAWPIIEGHCQETKAARRPDHLNPRAFRTTPSWAR